MAGSATIGGKQHYVLGIGHPMNTPNTEEKPAVGEESPGIKTIATFGSSTVYYSRMTDQISGSATGFMPYFLQRAKGAVRWIYSSGIAGEDSESQYNRLQTWIDSWTEVPTYTVLQIAGNDVTSDTALDTVRQRINDMVQWVLNAGSIPILQTPGILGAASGVTAAQVLRHAYICQHMTNLARFDSRIRLCDTTRYLADNTTLTYTPLAGTQRSDGYHTTALGGYVSGWYALWNAVAPDIQDQLDNAAMPFMLYDATVNPYGNLLPNPMLAVTATPGTQTVAGTVSTGAASIPEGMIVNRTAGAGTVAITKVARTDKPGLYWTRFTFTLGASDDWVIYMRPTVSPGSDKTLYGMMETQTDTSGITAGYLYTCSARTRDNTSTKTVWEMGKLAAATNAECAIPTHASQAEFRVVPEYTFPTFGSTGTFAFEVIATSTATGTFVLDIGSMGLYIKQTTGLMA